MKYILSGIVVIGALFGLMMFQQASVPSALTASGNTKENTELNAIETAYDFGTISMAAGKVTHRFAIENTSNEKITITTAYTSCMCTQARLLKGDAAWGPFGMLGHGSIPKIDAPLDAKEKAVVEVTFDPAAHGPAGVGPINRAVTLETSGGIKELTIAANVTP